MNRGSVSYNGTLEIEIGGTTPGSEYDQLNHILAAGVADLGGTLDVLLLSGYIPEADDTFDIITATTVQSTFDIENLPDLGGGLLFDVLYSATTVQVAVAGVPGDYNYDGTVDFTVWRAALVSQQASVPEPTSLWLLLMGAAVLRLGRRSSSGRVPQLTEPRVIDRPF